MKQINIKGPIVSNDDKWIYDLFEMACTTPGEFIAALDEAAGEEVQVIINSVGGYVMQAAEIYEAIRSYAGKITGKVIGQACSCASFIACAMYCEISPIGEIFIHNCSGGVEGDYRAMQQAKDALIQTNDNIILAYQEKTGISKEELQQMMDNNTVLSAQEAVKRGFVDKISENTNYISKHDDLGMTAMAASAVMPIFNLSEQKRAALAAIANKKSSADFIKNGETPKKEENMGSLEKFLASNPDAKKEYDAALESEKTAARQEGESAERARLKSIDDISENLTDEAVMDAKYTNPVTAEKLALDALKNGSLKKPEGSASPSTESNAGNQTAANTVIITKTAADYAQSGIANLQTPAAGITGLATGEKMNDVSGMSTAFSNEITRHL